ncbi:MAG TPA: hypothetical protein VFS18_02405, partial [Actinomycetota bacterium]|nr:hypothetical protein [Actinomycetota bacterium]
WDPEEGNMTVDGGSFVDARVDESVEPEPGPLRRGFSEAQRSNLTRLIRGSRFSVASEIAPAPDPTPAP